MSLQELRHRDYTAYAAAPHAFGAAGDAAPLGLPAPRLEIFHSITAQPLFSDRCLGV